MAKTMGSGSELNLDSISSAVSGMSLKLSRP